MANPANTNFFSNAGQNLSAGLTPFAQNFSYGNNTKASSTSQRNSWVTAATTNGAGPNADNSSSPWSFTQFALGLNPFVQSGGQATPSGDVNLVNLFKLIVVFMIVSMIFRKLSS